MVKQDAGTIDSARIVPRDLSMAEYKQVQQLSVPDAAWLAGLIDSEGTITLSRKHRLDNRQLVISISITEKKMLDYVMPVIGAGKC